MTYLFYLILSTALIVVQSTVLARTSFSGAIFDLVLPFIVYLGLFQPLVKGILVLLFVGYFKDALCGGPFGLYLSAYIWIYAGIRLSTSYFHSGNATLQTILIALAVIVENLIFIGFAAISSPGVQTFGSYANRIAVQTISALLAGAFILRAIRFLDERGAGVGAKHGKNKKDEVLP